jgi:hypothetical protein
VDPDPEDCIQPGTDLVFNPEEDAPSAAVGSGPCLDKALAANDPAAAALCFDYYAPDLVPELREPENNTDLQATAGGTLQFPIGGFDVVNQGTADATAENRPLRHGFYLTTDPTVEFDSDGIPTNAYRLGGAVSGPPGTTIPVGGRSEFDDPVMLTFPLNLTAGEYNLILYVDDYEEVSEFDEVNNKLTTVVPITVVTPVELLGNGSFEQPHLPSGWALFANGEVPGGWSFEWTACGDDCPVDPLLEIQTSGVAVAARDGSQYAELDSDGAPDRKANLRLYQDIDTCEGATYTLHYSWAKRTSDDLLDVSWGGDLKATNGDDAAIKQWHDETLQLLGDGTTLQLEFEEVGPPDTLGMLLDAVSLVGPECPPEVIGK